MERKVFIATLLICSTYARLLVPMVKQLERPVFSIRNLTNDKLAITLQEEEQESFTLTLIPKQVISFSHTRFLLIDVTIHGRYRSWIALPSLGYQGRELAAHVQELRKKSQEHLFLLVRPGSENSLGSMVLPYTMDFNLIGLPPARRRGTFMQLFPQVDPLASFNKDIHPRHVLSLPKGATAHACTSAFIIFTMYWDYELSGIDEQPHLKQMVLKFLEAAHASLLEGVDRASPITARFFELYAEYKNQWVTPNDATL